ncbi:MAG: ATP-binding protein [bacterium]|nr:ATP-binding protein [bacterium]
MLIHPTLDQLRALRLVGMAKAMEEQLQMSDIEDLRFEDRLGLLIDREATERSSRRLKTRLRKAKLRQGYACVEDVDYRIRRKLDKSLFLALASCDWIARHRNVLLTGSTGVGKTFLACALAQKACREGYTVQYLRVPRLFEELRLAHADGRYPKLMAGLAKTDLIVLDDWGLAPLADADRLELLEILEDRHEVRSTMVTSQLPVNAWHEAIDHPTLADAILDRLVHNAYELALEGESVRRKKALAQSTKEGR